MTTKFKIFAGSDGTSSENQKVEDNDNNKQAEQSKENPKPDDAQNKKEGEHGMSEADHKLLKDIMKKKEELKTAQAQIAEFKKKLEEVENLGGIEKLSAMLKAEEDKQKKELEAKGEWEKLKKQMSDDHVKAMSEIQKQLEVEKAKNVESEKRIIELTIGAKFANSQYINEQLTLTPNKARVIYDDYFDLVDGQVVGFDKPRGQKDRAPFVDQYGNNLPFDSAMEKIISADPDADFLLKSKIKSGAGSSSKTKSVQETTKGLTTIEQIAKGLSNLK